VLSWPFAGLSCCILTSSQTPGASYAFLKKYPIALLLYNTLVTPETGFEKDDVRKTSGKVEVVSESIFELLGIRSGHPCGIRTRLKRFTAVLNLF
jgi:hypothetical protein